jgi:hypothetical protein
MTMHMWIISLLLSGGGATSVSIAISASWASEGYGYNKIAFVPLIILN